MNTFDKDLDDSALFCKSLVQKRKAAGNGNPKNSKQLKICFSQTSSKKNQQNENTHVEASKNSIYSKEKTTGLDRNSKQDESRSSYFSVRKSVNTCPVCLKSFKSDSVYSAHMKQCAKSHKMTTQQLLGALELQKKQMQERKALGLCSQKVSSPPKNSAKKKKENDTEQYDLALGLALSRSLSTAETVGVIQTELQKPAASQTLEEFGFTTRNTALEPSRKKNDVGKKSVLRERTVEQRQRIIVEKVAVILLDENPEEDLKTKNFGLEPQFESKHVPKLWNMGENNDKKSWYVDGIKPLVLLEGESAREGTQTQHIPYSIEKEISKLSLPRKNIHEDWAKMINNCKLSDFTAKTKDCRDFYMHSVVVFARCPQILEKDCEYLFRKFNLSTVLIFLEFVYCGTLNSLTGAEVDKLLDLGLEFNYVELVTILNHLKSNQTLGDSDRIPNSEPEAVENVAKQTEANEHECKKATILEDEDLFADDAVDLTQTNHVQENSSENESNAEKSYWSFIQHEKKKEQLVNPETNEFDDENSKSKTTSDKINHSQRNPSDDSPTRDLDEDCKKTYSNRNSDCIILSSGSDSKTQENLVKPPRLTTPSPVNVDYEVPHFDPYDNFHFFSEDQLSPVATQSQSLITGDISMESLKSSDIGQENGRLLDDFEQGPKKIVGYCSTPVTIRQDSKVKQINSLEISKRRKMRDLSASRIIRKSLGLHQKTRLLNSNSSRKTPAKKAESRKERALTEALTNSILHELSKSSAFQTSPFARSKLFVEMTPISNRDEFVDNVTPSPNYSNMGESVLKEQLTKYGLKKNLAKSKAKKILRYIYEELHPLYNTETGKIVKMLPKNTSKAGKKSKSNAEKTKRTETYASGKNKKKKKQPNSSKESISDNGSNLSTDRLTNYDSDESEFENISETLTQSTPSNPVDLASAFSDFLEFNQEYHRQVLLYEPIWLEELQKKLKETFKKHFKISDLMDFLDQKCITFRSQAQARNLQRRNEKKKENCKKKKNNSS